MLDDPDKAAIKRSLNGTSWLRRLRRRLGRLVPGGARSPQAALSYRFLARQIDMDLPRAGGGRTILLSSVVPSSSSNQAMLIFSHALAEELSCRVLMMDGTFGDEGIGAMLGHAGAPGLIDLVHDDDHALGDLARPTPWHNVSVLPAGRARVSVLPIPADRVAKLYEQGRNQFDCVLVQQGSIVEDTRYLSFAAKADVILVLVDEGVTFVSELDRCLEVFRDHQISSVRLVLCAPS